MIPAAILLFGLLAQTGVCLFSVHDDILAFPQYEVQFPESFITLEEAKSILVQSQSGSSLEADGISPRSYEMMRMRGRQFLCAMPEIRPPPTMNATEKELSKVEEEREVPPTTKRGWELIKELDGKCLYFVSGWWSYSFCHNREVRQFHQLPIQHNDEWPPSEDPDSQSYVLGYASPENINTPGADTELQATGDLRYLVQKLGGGTICDLTGKERQVEVQFHCSSGGTDRIDWIKEVSICCYLMVVYTPRLCKDVTFLPPRDSKAEQINCREIMTLEQQEDFAKLKAKQEQADALRMLENAQKVLDARKVMDMKKIDKKLEDIVYVYQREL